MRTTLKIPVPDLFFIIIFSCLANDHFPKRKLAKLSPNAAVLALKSATYKDYMSAIHSVLVSTLPREKKGAALTSFFTDRKRIALMKKQGEKHGREVFLGLSLVAKHLGATSLLAILKHELYNPVKDDDHFSWELRTLGIMVVRDMAKPNKDLVMHIANLPGEFVGTNRMAVIARHGNDELLRETLELTRKDTKERQQRWYPEAMRSMCHRPLVLKYMVDSYLKFGYPVRLYQIMTRENNRPKHPAYEQTLKENAKATVKQIDRILKIKHVLLGLPDKNNRLDDEDLSELLKIRKVLAKKAKEKKR